MVTQIHAIHVQTGIPLFKITCALSNRKKKFWVMGDNIIILKLDLAWNDANWLLFVLKCEVVFYWLH